MTTKDELINEQMARDKAAKIKPQNTTRRFKAVVLALTVLGVLGVGFATAVADGVSIYGPTTTSSVVQSTSTSTMTATQTAAGVTATETQQNTVLDQPVVLVTTTTITTTVAGGITYITTTITTTITNTSTTTVNCPQAPFC